MISKKLILPVLFVLSLAAATAFPQTGPLLKRTTYKTDHLDFGVGGTLSITGAPKGSIRIEGWAKREIEISAVIEVQADTEQNLKRLSEITTFATEESLGRTGIISLGVNDKGYLKQLDKKVPKALRAMPFRIDYVIKVPQYCDLQIDGGDGDLTISGVEGTFKLNYLKTNARIELIGGSTTATFGSGTVDLTIPSAKWRGRFADIQLADGTLNLNLPPGINAEIDANILRTGTIDNTFVGLVPRSRKIAFTERSIAAKAGVGGISLKFSVGDGKLTIAQAKP